MMSSHRIGLRDAFHICRSLLSAKNRPERRWWIFGLIPLIVAGRIVLGGPALGVQASPSVPEDAKQQSTPGTGKPRFAQVVAQVGGATYAVAVQDSLAFLGVGDRLVIADIADPTRPVVVGKTDLLPGTPRRILLSGSYAYVLADDSMLYVVEVDDPTRPRIVAAVAVPDSRAEGDLAGDYVWVAAGYEGIRIIDVSDPLHPSLAGSYNTAHRHFTEQVLGAGSRFFTITGGAVCELDITNPLQPSEITCISTGGSITAAAVSGDWLYTADKGTDASVDSWDISDILHPTHSDSVTMAGDIRRMAATADYVYIAEDPSYSYPNAGGLTVAQVGAGGSLKWAGKLVNAGGHFDLEVIDGVAYLAAGGAGLRILDVSQPADVHTVGTLSLFTGGDQMIVAGDLAFVASFNVDVIDVSDPVQPILLAEDIVPGGSFIEAVALKGHYLLTAGKHLSVMDVTLATAPELVADYDLNGRATAIAVSGDYAYVARAWQDIVVLDISNVYSPTQVAVWQPPAGHSPYLKEILIEGSHAYVGGDLGGIYVLDVSEPHSPALTTRIGTYPLHGLAISESYLYVSDNAGINIYSLDDPGSPMLAGVYGTRFEGIAASGHYLYAANYGGGMSILDITNPRAPKRVGYEDGARYGRHIAVQGCYAYILSDSGQFQVIDTSHPADFAELAAYNPIGDVRDLSLQGHLLYAAAGTGGLQVIDVSDPAIPTAIGSHLTGDEANDVVVAGDRAYVAASQAGLEIFDVTEPGSLDKVGALDLPDSSRALDVSGNTVYVVGTYLRAIDVSNPAVPVEIGQSEDWFPSYPYPRIQVSDRRAYVATSDDGLKVYDITNPAALNELTWCMVGYGALDLALTPDGIYLASGDWLSYHYYDDGCPGVQGYYRVPAYGVTVASGIAFVAGGSSGTHLIDVTDPYAMREISVQPATRHATKVVPDGNYVYVADGEGGLYVLRLLDKAVYLPIIMLR